MIRRILSLIFVMTSVAFAQKGVPSKVTFSVRNDEGQPVTNALVTGCFLDLSQSGFRDEFKGQSDANGIYVTEGQAVLGIFGRFSSSGFYATREKKNLEYKRRQDGKGYESIDRWDVEIPVLLKRIRNQIPMFVKQVENPNIDLWDSAGKYRLAGASSYDIVKGDFLAPYGRGEVADLDFKWKLSIYTTNKVGRALDYDSICEVRLTNAFDGICRGNPDGFENGQVGSAYISGYETPVSGYTNTISFYRNVRGMKADSNDDKHYLYYFRIRTQTNALGQVTNALYGKIYGQINGRFTYYLNPTPNDRNIEFDPAKNLFGGRDRFAP
jgi:hypothetical protein